MSEKTKTNQKYEGPGKFTSAVGGFVLWSIPGAIVSSVANIPFRSAISEAMPSSLRELPNIKGFKRGLAGSVAGLVIAGYGAVKNWKKASNVQESLNTIKTERDEANIRNEVLQTQVNGLNEEVAVHRKRFTDSVSSRAAHGSHANAHEADKEHAAHAEAAR